MIGRPTTPERGHARPIRNIHQRTTRGTNVLQDYDDDVDDPAHRGKSRNGRRTSARSEKLGDGRSRSDASRPKRSRRESDEAARCHARRRIFCRSRSARSSNPNQDRRAGSKLSITKPPRRPYEQNRKATPDRHGRRARRRFDLEFVAKVNLGAALARSRRRRSPPRSAARPQQTRQFHG